MGKETGISWTHSVNPDGTTTPGSSWNPLRGCSRVSTECVNCYAERLMARGLPGLKSPTTGEDFAIMKNGDPHWTGKVELIESMLDLPIKWKKPRKIFVNSISDLFHESLPDEVIDRVFNVMAHCPQHTFIVLTKRHERMKQHLNKYWKDPLPNCWIGVSAGNQEMYNLRVPYLLDTPADVSFVSCEPLLGPIDITQVNGYPNWLILGGESGPGARPCDINWIDDIYIDCLFHNVPTFIKQLGAYPTSCGVQVNLKDRKGGNIEEFPSSLRVREFPKEK